MLTALALASLLAGLAGAAIGVVGYQTGFAEDADIEDISLASLIGGAVVLFLAYLVGGWAAGRMARYDGPRNGLMTGVWTILLAAILSALAAVGGAEYDVFRDVQLPQWFSTEALTIGAIVSGLVAIAVMLIAGAIGGGWGERYHRHADATIVTARDEIETVEPAPAVTERRLVDREHQRDDDRGRDFEDGDERGERRGDEERRTREG